MKRREAGVLLPLFSLPGEEGIGTMGKEARAFIDFLAETGNRVWQILPMGQQVTEILPTSPFPPLREIRTLLIWKA